MLIITSPAKALDFTSEWTSAVATPVTKPVFLRKAGEIVKQLHSHTPEQLRILMKISDVLASENVARYAAFSETHTRENARPAILAYRGDIYRQLKPRGYSQGQQQYLQNSLRILSGLYGILRPYDLMQPYRLEIKTPLAVGAAANLYEFWRYDITKALNDTARQDNHPLVLNLASNEYADAIDAKLLSIPMVEVVFTQEKNGTIFNFGLYAKRARGMMIQYLTEIQGTGLSAVRSFYGDGYRLHEETEKKLVFRKKTS